jgi:hypothetical protein
MQNYKKFLTGKNIFALFSILNKLFFVFTPYRLAIFNAYPLAKLTK